MPEMNELKELVTSRVDAHRDRWISIADTIHANPEIADMEFKSMAILSGALEEDGFAVSRGVADLETAFVATAGSGNGPALALLAEYDALPEIGHGCGHNLIGTASVAAGVALLPVLDRLPGTLKVIGTPAEEGGAGKVPMVAAGVFDGLDAALMFHPSEKNMTSFSSLACFTVLMEFFGRESHAAASPEKGINALDACVLTYANIGVLRQQLADDARIHGIITHGGVATNVIPGYAAAKFVARARKLDDAVVVLEKVENCARAGALAAGAELKLTREDRHYKNMVSNQVLADLFDANLLSIGRVAEAEKPNEPMGSTDMGNVSHVIPALHPFIQMVAPGVDGHSLAFRDAAASPEGHEAMLDAAKVLAMTCVDLLSSPDLIERAWEKHWAVFAGE